MYNIQKYLLIAMIVLNRCTKEVQHFLFFFSLIKINNVEVFYQVVYLLLRVPDLD